MRILPLPALLLALNFHASPTLAADATVVISSPAAGSKFDSMTAINVAYTATPGANGDHVHLALDDQPPVILRKLIGSHTLQPLAPGKHGICIRLVTKEHIETGIQDCVMFRVE